MDADIKPFNISISDAKIAHLRQKLEHATFLHEMPLSDSWSYGVRLSDIKRLYTTIIYVDGFDPLKIGILLTWPSKPGFALEQYAESCHKLILKLGRLVVTQGGDWGYGITRFMGIRYGPMSSSATDDSGAVLASHINHNLGVPPSISQEKAGLARTDRFWEEGAAYNRLHCHNLTTIGIALRDSPVVLLSWIYGKLHDWTDDEILTRISIYQFSDAGPEAGCRVYYENAHLASAKQVEECYPGAKVGVSTFPQDFLMSLGHCQTLGSLVFEKWHD
ncbi:Alpha/Beta hydrolase protein [Cercophora samala]|uniref:Alpha/Beta hydrolase protein n=1 Tax=Cercophora samala TaxID=330535 RepID=A0AA39ZBI7_9PEZI|nr:Alpha/Beta hydrolase protein [Cercophora samala]